MLYQTTRAIGIFSIVVFIAISMHSTVLGDQDEPKPEDPPKEEKIKEEKESKDKKKQSDVQVEVDLDAKKDKKEGSHNNNTTGDSHIDNIENTNSGFQMWFINSDVEINGGTIKAEIHNEKNLYSKDEEEGDGVDKPSVNGRPGGRPPQGNGGDQEQPSEFDKQVKDATKEEGLFTVYTQEDLKVFWEIPKSAIGQEHLLSGHLATGVGAGMAKAGANLGGIIFYPKIENKKMQLYAENLRYKAPVDSPESKSVKKNYSDSVLASLPIAATNPETGGHLVEVTKLFMSDPFRIQQMVVRSLGGGYGIDQGNSFIQETNVFPKNVNTRVKYYLRGGGNSFTAVLPDARSAVIEVLINIMPVEPNPEFEPRLADTRVGYFNEAHVDFGNKEQRNPVNRLISRWDIRKASPELEMSPPVKPLVFWIENTVPEEYRPYVKEGLESWNKTFEAIGIKNAIVAKIQPEDADWDISDVRYNTVHWNVSRNRAYSGIAQWIADPRTGEILNGSFLLEGEMVRQRMALLKYNKPEDRMNRLKEMLTRKRPSEIDHTLVTCTYQDYLSDNVAMGLDIMAARNGGAISEEEREEIVKQLVIHVTAHELGHVLGLRHNFEASTLHPVDQLHNQQLTREEGLVSSVMDYTSMNIAPEGMEQGDFFSVVPGPYDHLAIEYGYVPIKSATGETQQDVLNRIAEKGETRRYAYDEDISRILGLDPLVNAFDLGREPLNFAKKQAQLVKDTIPKLPNLVNEGDDYTIVRDAFDRMVTHYFSATGFALKYLGGQYVTHVKKGGPQDPSPLEPVSAAKQREALNFILEEVFSAEVFDVDPELVNMLANEHWIDWDTQFIQSTEYSLQSLAFNLYDQVIYALYGSYTLQLIKDQEVQVPKKEVAYTLPEYFNSITDGVWSEVTFPGLDDEDDFPPPSLTPWKQYSNTEPFINTYRRILQRQHAKRLINMALQLPFGTPEDARSLAYKQLREIEDRIDDCLDMIDDKDLEMDEYSELHLEETREMIERALDADVTTSAAWW